LRAGGSNHWNEDFSIDITPQVKTGENRIVVQVTNGDSGGITKGVFLMEL